MEIVMQKGKDHSELEIESYEIAFVGEAIDKRGQISTHFLGESVPVTATFSYYPDDFQISEVV